MTTSLERISTSTVEQHDMFAGGCCVLAMASGGADSTSLLALLASGALGAFELAVLHVNHMLRGEASDADAAFVEATCDELGVPCRIVAYDVAAYAGSEGLNLEDAGRRIRYRFAEEELDAMCVRAGCRPQQGRIAVAHTFDDRMETFLMRLAAGAGATGLAAIPHVRGRIVRPLLDARRADVTAYLESLGRIWREDATNADTTRLRARVRAELLPLLEAINPRFDDAVFRTLTVLSGEDDLLTEMADGFVAGFVESSAEEVRFDRAPMLTLSHAISRRVVRSAIIGAFPGASRLEFEHIEAVVEGMALDTFARDLPFGLRAFVEYDRLVVSRTPGETLPVAPSLLEVPGVLDMGDAGRIVAEYAEPVAADEGAHVALIDADRVSVPLTVDSMRPGDRMRPLGMQGTRKLQDVLTDAKIPRRTRLLVPVVRDGDSIVWVAGVRMSEEFRITPSTRRAIRMEWTGQEPGKD